MGWRTGGGTKEMERWTRRLLILPRRLYHHLSHTAYDFHHRVGFGDFKLAEDHRAGYMLCAITSEQ
jgi:hypothetical protein